MMRNDQLELDYIEQTTRNVPSEAWLTINIHARPEFKLALDKSYRSICFYPVDIYKGKTVENEVVEKIANDLNTFSKVNDTYNYWDNVDNSKDHIDDIVKSIENRNDESLRKYLKEFIEESRDEDVAKEAEELLKRIDDYLCTPVKDDNSHIIYQRFNTEALWLQEDRIAETELQTALYKFDRSMYPEYVRTHDGNIGQFSFLDEGQYPVYDFTRGERRVDNWELEHGADNIKELKENFMSMQGLRDRMEKFIQETVNKTHPDLILTERTKEALISRLDKALTDGDISMNELYEGAESFLKQDSIAEFVRSRQPEISPVPESVIEHVKSYFEKELPGFTPVLVQRSSNASADNYLYSVAAKGASGKYACWSSWNESLQSLNHGHYNITEDVAVNILKENFYDVTDEIALYGPEKSRVTLNGSGEENELQNKPFPQETQENEVQRHKGR